MQAPEIKLFALLVVSFLSVHVGTTEAFSFPHQTSDNDQTVKVQIKPVNTTLTRLRRSVDLFPDELDITLSTDEIHQNFHHLRRNFDLSDEKPIYLMHEGKVKRYRFNSKEKVAHYSELDSGATFMVWPKSEEIGTAGEFDIFGTFVSDNQEQYLVQPPTQKNNKYTLSKFTDDTLPVGSDYIFASNTDEGMMQDEELKTNRTSNTTSDRVKRQTTDYEIELFFVMDYAMYEFWYKYTEGQVNRRTTTLKYIYELAAFLLNAINLRYETVTGTGYTITCTFAGIYVAENRAAAPFVEDNVSSLQFVAGKVLNAFRLWAEATLDGHYDHAMLFSGYDMGVNGSGTFNSNTAGLAYMPIYNDDTLITPGVCGSYRYSIVEARKFNPNVATVGAHELGHNFNSKHDKLSLNTCNEYDGYVMSPSSGPGTDASKNLRLWSFSACSRNYFDTYVNDMLKKYEGEFCILRRVATNTNALDPYIYELPGQTYDPDAQCERLMGPGSYLSRGYFDGDYSHICTKMPCAKPEVIGSSNFFLAWEGTACGNRKICQGGQCVTSDSGQEVSDACPFGDHPNNITGRSETCQQFIGTDAASYRCYYDLNRKRCCATCETFKQNSGEYTDCDYGDRSSVCPSKTEDIKWCRSETNRATCCKSCVDKQLDIPGCPYGDRVGNCADLPCSTYAADCCETCAPSTTSTTTTTSTSTTTTTPTTTTTTSTTTPTTTTPTTTTTTTPTTTTTTTPTTTTTTTPTTTTTTTTTTPTTTTTTTPTTTTITPTTTTTTPTTTTTTPTTTTTTPTSTTTTSTTTTPTTTTTTTTPTTTTTTTSTTTTPTTTSTTPTTTATTLSTSSTIATTPTTSPTKASPTTTPTTTSHTSTSTTPTPTTTTTTTNLLTSTTSGKNVRIIIFIIIFPINTVFIDLNNQLVQQDIQFRIFIFYQRFLGIRIRRGKVRGLRRGSLIVVYDVEVDDDNQSAADLTQANIDLVSGKESITLLNETVSATSVQIDETKVTKENVNSPSEVCELFFQSYGSCDDNYACAVEEGRPVCVKEKAKYGFALLIAVTASVFVFILVISIIVYFSIRAFRQQKSKHNPGSLSTSTTDTEEQHWSNDRHNARYGVLGGRPDRPVAYLPYSKEVIRENSSYRTDRQHREEKNSRYNQSRDSHRSSHRASHRSDRNRQHLHNYGYDNRALE